MHPKVASGVKDGHFACLLTLFYNCDPTIFNWIDQSWICKCLACTDGHHTSCLPNRTIGDSARNNHAWWPCGVAPHVCHISLSRKVCSLIWGTLNRRIRAFTVSDFWKRWRFQKRGRGTHRSNFRSVLWAMQTRSTWKLFACRAGWKLDFEVDKLMSSWSAISVLEFSNTEY